MRPAIGAAAGQHLRLKQRARSCLATVALVLLSREELFAAFGSRRQPRSPCAASRAASSTTDGSGAGSMEGMMAEVANLRQKAETLSNEAIQGSSFGSRVNVTLSAALVPVSVEIDEDLMTEVPAFIVADGLLRAMQDAHRSAVTRTRDAMGEFYGTPTASAAVAMVAAEAPPTDGDNRPTPKKAAAPAAGPGGFDPAGVLR
eukprot:TRINITY_DN45325_c0_g2_i1.p1 TRINITY_DN45325_c0_g2~~TRINITY_DN45325_c0_g2_i1.p1  ORF type:complete len:221 (+),score=35.88 TRINITY_DN45325_c0_g2_i1:58-663(+)